jgi:DNA polymerase III delta prime subunit
VTLKEILLKKGQKQELAHFYILETAENEASAEKALLSFTHEFIRDYYQKVEGHKQTMQNLMDHPDVYVLGNTNEDEDDRETSAFTVEESEKFSRFFEFKPVQGKRKFAVITEGHRITSTVANKWLKLLEEPLGESTIFLLNPRRTKLLDTIHSRALHLRLPTSKKGWDQTEWNEFLKETKSLTLSKFLEKYSKGDREISFWMGELIQWEAEQSDQSEAKNALEAWVRMFQEMEVFNQPAATKWTLLFRHLQDHVLPRHLL